MVFICQTIVHIPHQNVQCALHTCFILVNILIHSSLTVLTLPNYILSIPLPVTWLPIKISNLAHNYYLCSDSAYFFATKPGLRHVNGESCSDRAPPIPNTSIVIYAAKPSHCLYLLHANGSILSQHASPMAIQVHLIITNK